jgi:hypothetical protein
LLYQIGKVGSQTVHRTLGSIDSFDRPVIHLHSLRVPLLKDVLAFRRLAARQAGAAGLAGPPQPRFARQGLEVARAIARDPQRSWTVVTLVRDPVARDVSSFFQNLRSIAPFDLERRRRTTSPAAIAEELWPRFAATYIEREENPAVMAGYDWFDDELKAVLGVDVYSSPFPHDLGYQVVTGSKARVLLIRVEDLDRVGLDALEEFLGIRFPRLVVANTVEEKAVGELSSAFKELPFPRDYLDRAYGSRLARHFYTTDELIRFSSRWCVADRPRGLGWG